MKIVAPAGSLERFYAAIKASADEIYMGIKGFGARRNAVNLTIEEYKEAIDYAHARGVKVFLTLNTIMMDAEIEGVSTNLGELYKYGLDAVIVQDFGLAKFIGENFPDIELHGSTQMTVANHVEANYLKEIGFTRVVLPRELSFEEIKSIREKTDIELEVFVSGALCISYSGNCYMSSFIGGRSGNRGMCAQPCRKSYTSKDGEKGYLLSPKDQLFGFEEVKKLKEIGIDSIKLEGRMKEPNYVFQTVTYFKNLIDGIESEENSSNLFNRGYSKGFFYGDKTDIINREFSKNIGKELGRLKGNELILEEDIVLGDGIIYLSKEYETLGGTYINRIITKNGIKKTAKKGEILVLRDVPKGTKYIHRNYSKEINDLTEKRMKKEEKKHLVIFKFTGKIGEKAKIEITTKNNKNQEVRVTFESEELLEEAKNRGTTKEIVKSKLEEIGDTTFTSEIFEIDIDENIFIPMTLLKQLKRETVSKLLEKLILSYRRELSSPIKRLERKENKEENKKGIIISAIVSTMEQKRVVEELNIEKIYFKGYDVAREGNLKEIDLENTMASNLYQLLENRNSKVTLGWNLNITNRYAFSHFEKIKKVDTIIVSPEISYKRLEEIGETKIKKAVLVYARPRAMYTEISLFEDEIVNEQGDRFTVLKNSLGNSEIYLEHPLNVLRDREYLEKIGITELVLEFTTESEDEIKKIIRGEGMYLPYNYEKGVF